MSKPILCQNIFETFLSIDNRSPFSDFFLHENIKMHEILTSIMNKRWFGLCCIDIVTPESVKSRYKKLNFGTIFEKLEVTEDMLSDVQKAQCLNSGMKFPLHPQLV